MLEFAAAVFFLIVTPGPGVLSTAGVGSAYGTRAGLAYVSGLWVGNNLVAGLVVSGLAAAALAVPWLRAVLLWGSAAYLLYLAAKIALAGARIGFIHPERSPGFWNGLALQPINPKAYAVNTAFFSGFAFMAEAPGLEVGLKFLIINAIWIPIHLAWLWAGVTLRRMELPARVNRAINIVMAAAMLIVVALAVQAQL
ncbi:LysE family transporter [Paralimibaculum aggregatum]|uniref:LysE family transporter n=1 Tax=Paralimibaculum aggregatum TaxID=3036245 RepID=A0ABQ6LNQ6_9RHOB|nr:LysE family translocator [Limibaculum sp. NKW23]GMG84798.1 LysE family transporter [Limibaculum sp. NKW23]